MNKFKRMLAVIAMLGAVLMTTACTPSSVERGQVGIIVNKLGDNKGVADEVKGVGRYWLTINEELYTFPVFLKTVEYVEPFTFQDKEGTSLSVKLTVKFTVEEAKVPVLFQRYQKGVDEIAESELRVMIRDALIKASESRSAEDMYGSGKSQLLKEVENTVRKNVAPYGIVLDSLSYMSGVGIPANIRDALNRKIEQKQLAEQRQNEIIQSEAEADKKRAEAKGVADSLLIVAQAEADAIAVQARALNQNPQVLKLRAIEKWNGVLPQTDLNGQSSTLLGIK